MFIYRMYITDRNGNRIYRKNKRPFRFWVDDPEEEQISE